jgi:NADP-dependent 3-hydroxy acid dehydrogenase YdfG
MMNANHLVLGAQSGLGSAISFELVRRGFSVARHSRLPADGFELTGDASSKEFSQKLRDFLSINSIDTVFFSIGSYSTENAPGLNLDEVDLAYKNNLLAGIVCLDAIVSAWINRQRGKIVVVNSIAALQVNQSEQIYGAFKQSLSYFTKSLRLEVLAHGIQIMEILPGAMKTRMTSSRDNWDRLMDPSDVAKVVIDLASHRSFTVSTLELRNLP